jgi:hypothetical protein
MLPVLQSMVEMCSSLVTVACLYDICAESMTNVYIDSAPNPDVSSNSRITIVPLQPPPLSWQTSNKLFFLFFAPLKVFFQTWSLWVVLGYRTKPSKWMLVQVSFRLQSRSNSQSLFSGSLFVLSLVSVMLTFCFPRILLLFLHLQLSRSYASCATRG